MVHAQSGFSYQVPHKFLRGHLTFQGVKSKYFCDFSTFSANFERNVRKHLQFLL